MLDALVAGAQARGLQVLLTPTGPIPAWASRCGGSVAARRVCKPDPQAFGAFVRALGTRYPTVKLWSIWNEPNLRSWLSPQYEVVGSQAVQRSAYLYRSLAASAIAGLRATGHRADQIWLGETAPLGDDPSGCSAQRSLRVPKQLREQDPQDLARDVPARRLLPQHEGQEADGRRGLRPALRRLQEAQRHRLRASSVHARRLASADLGRQRG